MYNDFINTKSLQIDSRVDSSILADKDRDILHPSYILDCINAKKLLPIGPKYMFYTSPKTQKDFLQTMDVYGDYYNKRIKAKDLIEVYLDTIHSIILRLFIIP